MPSLTFHTPRFSKVTITESQIELVTPWVYKTEKISKTFMPSDLQFSFVSISRAKSRSDLGLTMSHQTPRIARACVRMQPPTPRPRFIYGTLCALPLLAWVLTGDAKNVAAVARLTQPAWVKGYARFAVRNSDCAAAVKHPPSFVEGYLLKLETESQRTRLDDFEGDSYKLVPVKPVTGLRIDQGIPVQSVEADMYVWAGDVNALTVDPWSVRAFEKEKLKDWLDTFQGMEFIGQTQEKKSDEWTIIESA
ncbi:hypothetical protein F5B21DRAFT_169913 [Xylaria acuta]|nr:hypothetical protein F5B21DRAFT_169913 [Xylaria acuta]